MKILSNNTKRASADAIRHAPTSPAVGEPKVDTQAGRGSDWLVDGLLRRGGTAVFAAPPKSGMTWLALDLLVAVAAGTEFLGRATFSPPNGTVAFFAYEGRMEAIQQRLRWLILGRGLDEASLSRARIRLAISSAGHLLEGNCRCVRDDLRAAERVSLIVLDAPLFDEYDRRCVEELRTLASDTNAAVVVTRRASKRRRCTSRKLVGSRATDALLFLQPKRKAGIAICHACLNDDARSSFDIGLKFTTGPNCAAFSVVEGG